MPEEHNAGGPNCPISTMAFSAFSNLERKAIRDPVDRSCELAFIFLLGMVGLDADDEKEHRMSNNTRTNNPKKQGMTIKERRAEKRAKAHAERHLFTRRKRAGRTKFDISR